MQLGYSILVSTSGFQSFGRSLQAPANAQTCLLAEAETSRSAWYPRMQVLVEFVLHGPSSAFPCVTTNMLFINSKCSTQPTPGCVTWRQQRPETARSARHTPAPHTAHPQTPIPTGATGLHHARYVPLPPSPIAPPCGYTRLRAAGARNREPTPQQAHSERRVRPVWRSYAQSTC